MKKVSHLFGISFKFAIVLEAVLIASSIVFSTASGGTLPEIAQHILYMPLIGNKTIDLFVDKVKVIQGTSPSAGYQVAVADRPTLVRVFVGSKDGITVGDIAGQICGYNQAGTSLGCRGADNGSITAPSLEDKLNRTLNFTLPLNWIKTGYSYFVTIDPQTPVGEANIANNRYPVQGRQPFDFAGSSPLNVRVVPVKYIPYPGSQSTQPKVSDLDYLTWLPIKILPVSSIAYEPRVQFVYQPAESELNLDNSSGWGNLLGAMGAIHAMEDPAGVYNYYGLVNSYAAHGCGANGCITGVSYLGRDGPYQTAVGWSGLGAGTEEASPTLTHELGHNFGRKHVLCAGNENNVDPLYPYPGGSIGQFGLDVVESVLYNPSTFKDFMSYCTSAWTSDYTFWNIYQYRQEAAKVVTLSTPPQESIYLWGRLSPEGEVDLGTVYRQFASAPLPAAGDYLVEMLGGESEILAAYPFEMVEIADAPGTYSFGFFVPDEVGLSGLRIRQGEGILAEKFVQGELISEDEDERALSVQSLEGGAQVRWPAVRHQSSTVVYRLRFSQDGGQSWQVLALDWSRSTYPVPRELLATSVINTLLEVQASDGIHTRTKIYEIKTP